MMMMRRRELCKVGAALLACPGGWAAAAELPTSVKYVVPFPPGGLTDVMARIAGQKLAEAIKVPVLVENKAGGNAQIGAEQVAKGPADGSQLLAITLAHAANVTLFPHAQYKLLRDLQPVALLAGSPMLVVVPAASPIKDLDDLRAAAKKSLLNAGSSGNGTPPHLTMALFNELNRSQMTHVPYRGGAPSMTDLIGGLLDVVFSNFPESIAHVKAGKLRALALCSAARHPQLPNVPTTAEAGMRDLLVENWTAAMMRAGTPDAIVNRYSRELIKALFSPDVEERARAMGFTPSPKGSQEFGVFLRAEIERWAHIIKIANITAG